MTILNNKVKPSDLEQLLAELQRVTRLVASRVQALRAAGPTDDDEFKGLYVSEEEVDQLLSDPYLFQAGSFEKTLNQPLPINSDIDRLSRLKNVFGLSAFELDVILIALAPELELRYEKLFAYLQDDVTRRRPSVDVALRLLCPGLAGQVAARRCFDADAPLIKYRLIELSDENQNRQISLLARSIKLDEGVIAYLLGEVRVDARLRHLADFIKNTDANTLMPEAGFFVDRLAELSSQNFLCVLVGSDEVNKRYLAGEVCRQGAKPLLEIDAAMLPGLAKTESLLRLLDREALLRGAGLYIGAYDQLFKEEGKDAAALLEARRLILRMMRSYQGTIFVSSTVPLEPVLTGQSGLEFQIRLNLPGYSERQNLWEKQLGQSAMGLDLEGLSSRFRLSSGQILAAATTAYNAAAWRGETVPTLADLEAGCRSHSNQRLSSLARKIEARYRWDDIVLPPDQFNMLHEICEQVKHRSLVYEKWGFDSKMALGKGLNIVFAGPSGTGKTMSAEIIATELKMDLYKIDLSNMVSKYIGETEKNLEKIFNEAGESNAILFFDEADSLFGKRSEVKDAHDRYANIETGYLLQKMEEYDGIVILATNLRKNLDDAFIRRLHFMLEYPFPEEEDRYQIWHRAFPRDVPLGSSVDLRFMARQFKLSGGNIKNIALATAFLAASEHAASSVSEVEMEHLILATRREFQKMGKLCTETDFGRYFSFIKDIEPKIRNSVGAK